MRGFYEIFDEMKDMYDRAKEDRNLRMACRVAKSIAIFLEDQEFVDIGDVKMWKENADKLEKKLKAKESLAKRVSGVYKFGGATATGAGDQTATPPASTDQQKPKTKEEWRQAHKGAYTFGESQGQLGYNNPYDSIEGPKGLPAGWDPSWGAPTRQDWLLSYGLPAGTGAGSYDTAGGAYPTQPKAGDIWTEADVPVYGNQQAAADMAAGKKPRTQPITGPSAGYIKETEAQLQKEHPDYIPGGFSDWLSHSNTAAAQKYQDIRDKTFSSEDQAGQDDRNAFFKSVGINPQDAGSYSNKPGTAGPGSVDTTSMFQDQNFLRWLQSGNNMALVNYLMNMAGAKK
jgi:hypothetical protein